VCPPWRSKADMHFVILGAGALGSIYAAHLAKTGHQVSLIARGERASNLRQHGLQVTGLSSFHVHCDIVTEPEQLETADVVIVAVKTYDTEAALAPLSGLSAKTALSVQNGVLKNDQLAQVFGQSAVIGAVSMFGGQVMPVRTGNPGEVTYNNAGPTTVGELDGTLSPRVADLVDALQTAGLVAGSSESIAAVEWSKFIGWSGISALAVLTRLPSCEIFCDPDTALLVARVSRETAAVAKCHGISVADTRITGGTESEAVEALMANGERMRSTAPDFRQSMLQDADNNRPMEVHETLAYTLSLADRYGVETPTLDYCCRILSAISAVNEKTSR
jgi:2-dehydropantoate 2-reductase